MNWKRNILLLLLATIVIALVALFSLRNTLLKNYVQGKIERYSKSKNIQISINKIYFNGLTTVNIEKIFVKPFERDTFFQADTISVALRFWPILKGNFRPDEFFLSGSRINFSSKDSISNYSFLFDKEENKPDEDSVKSRNYASYINTIAEFVFESIPANLLLTDTRINFVKDSISSFMHIPLATFRNNKYETLIITGENENKFTWQVEGEIERSKKYASVRALPTLGNKQYLPIFLKKYKLTSAFDSLKMDIKVGDLNDDDIIINGNSFVYGLRVNHWRISPSDVIVPKSEFNYNISVKEKQIQLDSTSTVVVSNLPSNVYVNYNNLDQRELNLKYFFKNISADTFFNALPQGLFENVRGIKAKGTLSYNMSFYYPFKEPDSLKFSSLLSKKDFKILSYGNTNLSHINNEFMHTVYEKDKFFRTFIVGPSNSNFTSINNISEYFKNSVLISEDGNFYWHKGFNEEAFQQAMATNIKEKRFVRGGSTISMQLVKNLFLTRNKTISRKIEEALIVWLIENNRIVSKERVFEIYLNIIEFGPGVYGIGEASQFYFLKPPSQLSLEESLFLAMIIPRPKFFKYNFDAAGNLKPHVIGYFNLITSHLLKKGVITEDQKAKLIYNVKLKGNASNFVKITAPADSIKVDELEIKF